MNDVRTSRQWREETRDNPERFHDWLLDQYRGEATAAGRIELLRDVYAQGNTNAMRVLTIITEQERDLAQACADLSERAKKLSAG